LGGSVQSKPLILSQLHQMRNYFQSSFTDVGCYKFALEWSSKIPSHPKCVTMFLCKI